MSDAVCQRNTDKYRRYDGNPHGGHGITGASHDTGETLCHRHGDIADRKDLHHIGTQRHQLGGIGEDTHQIFSENQNQARDRR